MTDGLEASVHSWDLSTGVDGPGTRLGTARIHSPTQQPSHQPHTTSPQKGDPR